MTLHAFARLAVVSALVGGAATAVPATAQAAPIDAVVVGNHSTGSWGRPSPDPSGITYDPVRRQLIISDGEVDEIPGLYQGTNVFFSSLGGVQMAGNEGWTTQPWSNEPTGISYQTDRRIFVSDDDKDRVFLVDPGVDGIWTPEDGTPQSFSVRPLQGDPEDVTADMDVTGNGHLLVLDGFDTEVYDYGTGPDGLFNGVPGSGGDDTVVSFDIGQYGAVDAEGLEYHPGRDTLLVLDGGNEQVYELDRQGRLLNVISIAAASPHKAAGLTLAPASDGSGRENLYVVDRGRDNDLDPTQNDGRLYELAVAFPPLGGVVNAPPSVDAGADSAVTMPAAASLMGAASDDGLPTPPGALTTTWTKASGTGEVTFGDPAAQSTTATFSAPGTYVLRLTAFDGEIRRSDDVVVQVSGNDGLQVLDFPVQAGTDDAEQRSASTVLTGADLDMTEDVTVTNTTRQTVGLRFAGLPVPQGSTVAKAYVQFTVADVTTAPASLTISGQAADDAATFTTARGDVSDRPRTAASVAWNPAPWSTRSVRTPENRTEDVSAIVQEIVDRGGWASGNALVLVVTGTGTRSAESFEAGAAKAAALHVEFRAPEPPNAAPSADAGPDVAVVQPQSASLSGTVSDDGRPTGSTLTAAWTQVSGPGQATFADPAAAATTASFTAAGTYVLRLTADDGALTAADDVTVEVAEAPEPSGVVEVPVRASVDDAEERSSGSTGVTSGDLNMAQDGTKVQTVGVRFTGVDVPRGATITSASLQFQVDEVTTGATSLTVAGQAADDALSFASTAGNVSSRPRTQAAVAWQPAAWTAVGLRGAEQRTPDLAAVVQEIVNRPGWASGNAMALVLTGTGTRTAESFDGGAAKAPVLRIEYGGGPAGGGGGTGGGPGGGTGGGGDGGSGTGDVRTLTVPVRAGVDDAEERVGSSTALTSGDLNLVQDDARLQTVGVRFAGVDLPAGATVVDAYVQFQADEVDTGAASLTLAGEAADHPLSFASTAGNVSSRPRTQAAVAWQPAAWTAVGLRGAEQRTPNLAAVVQEIVNRPGWASGNALAFVVTGTGTRTAESYDGGTTKAPVLVLRYTV